MPALYWTEIVVEIHDYVFKSWNLSLMLKKVPGIHSED